MGIRGNSGNLEEFGEFGGIREFHGNNSHNWEFRTLFPVVADPSQGNILAKVTLRDILCHSKTTLMQTVMKTLNRLAVNLMTIMLAET